MSKDIRSEQLDEQNGHLLRSSPGLIAPPSLIASDPWPSRIASFQF